MSTYQVNLSRNLAGGDLSFTLRFIDSDISANEDHILIACDSFSVGNDNISDLIYYAGNFKIEFKVDGDITKWQSLYTELLYNKCLVDVHDGTSHVWGGYIDTESLAGNSLALTLEFTVIDQMKTLENFLPADNPLGYTMGYAKTVIGIIKDIVTSTVFFDEPYISDVVYLGVMELRNDFGSGYETKAFTDIYAPYESFFDSNSNYENMLELLKQLLLNYNLVGLIGFDRKFYLIPRAAENPDIIVITKDMLNSEPEWEIVRKQDGVKAYVYTGGDNDDGSKKYYEATRGTIDENSTYEEIYIDQPCGWFGEHAYSGVLLKNSSDELEYVTMDVNGNFRTKKENGDYTFYSSLWALVINSAYDLIKIDRQKVKLKVDGDYNDFPIYKYYQIDGIPITFRAAKGEYDSENKEVTLSLRQSHV